MTVTLATAAFPFLGSPTRSTYTRAVSRNEHLRDFQGIMQAINSMMVTVPGFIGPSLIARFILRTRDEVSVSPDGRVFTPAALFAPVLAACSLAGFVYVESHHDSKHLDPSTTSSGESFGFADNSSCSLGEFEIDERLALLSSTRSTFVAENGDEVEVRRLSFDPRTEGNRAMSVMLMNIPQFCYQDDRPVLKRRLRHTV